MSYEFFLDYELFLLVMMMDISILRISSQSCSMDSYSFSEIYSVFSKRDSQYWVSLASFCEIDNLWIKSGVDSADNASLMLAPMEVPLRRSCLLITVSFFVPIRYLYKLTIRTAKLHLLVHVRPRNWKPAVSRYEVM